MKQNHIALNRVLNDLVRLVHWPRQGRELFKEGTVRLDRKTMTSSLST